MSKFEIITTKELLERLNDYEYKQLHIHHTWSPSHKNFTGSNHVALQQAMANYHINTNGWSDIGQHITLMPDGLWVTGRDFGKNPASIKYWNNGAFAVEMLGNFDIKHDILDGEQKESILELSRYFVKRFGKDVIKFHREGPEVTKTCPGSRIDKNKFMQEVLKVGKVFIDVEDDRWSAKYIEAAKELGLITGELGGNFNPEGSLTREQMAVVAVRLYERITGKKVV